MRAIGDNPHFPKQQTIAPAFDTEEDLAEHKRRSPFDAVEPLLWWRLAMTCGTTGQEPDLGGQTVQIERPRPKGIRCDNITSR